MSIIIEGVEMPPSCYFCPMTNDGFYLCKANNPYRQLEGDCEERRPEWCPIVHVPEHGRLIDADALLMRINHEVMEAYMDGACYGVHPSQEYLYLLGEIIDDAPTIIQADPAEGGEL